MTALRSVPLVRKSQTIRKRAKKGERRGGEERGGEEKRRGGCCCTGRGVRRGVQVKVGRGQGVGCRTHVGGGRTKRGVEGCSSVKSLSLFSVPPKHLNLQHVMCVCMNECIMYVRTNSC